MTPPVSSILGALDVGNHRVLALLAERDEHAKLVIRGVGTAASAGLQNGQVVQLQPLVAAIRKAVEEAEYMAGVTLESVYASTAGTFVTGRMTSATVALGPPEREVRSRDLEQAHLAVQWQALPPNHMVLNVLTHSYGLDGQEGLVDPIEMVGQKLSLEAYVLACQKQPVLALERAINKAGLRVKEFLFAPVAAALACLTPDERRLGSLLVDIGFANTCYAAVVGERVVAAGCLPLGSGKVNTDLVYCFHTTTQGAEEAKVQAGTVLLSEIDPEETVTVPSIDGRGHYLIPRREMNTIIRLRMHEIFEIVTKQVIRDCPSGMPSAGVVLVGGGSHLDGVAALAEEVFGTRCRLGEPEDVEDATQLLQNSELPARSAAVAVGLLTYAAHSWMPTVAPAARLQAGKSNWLLNKVRKVLSRKGVTR
ncbi:MAG: cell division protein FtsA [Thermoanaerobaculaceae bacterium]|nr:cell division protein FtsA [Thermoanaerobaculaceae bacterium]